MGHVTSISLNHVLFLLFNFIFFKFLLIHYIDRDFGLSRLKKKYSRLNLMFDLTE